jgi:ATP-binding cassette subfamily A (ABC1) protein 3
VKHQQFVSGVGPISYWTAMFAFDMTTFMVPMVATVALIVIFGVDSFSDPDVLGAIVVVLLGFALSVMPFTYLTSHLFSKHTTAQNVSLLFNLMTGLVLMITSFVLDVLDGTKDANMYLKYIYRLFPGFCLGDSFLNLSMRGILSAFVEDFDESPYQLDVTGINIIYLYVGAVVFTVATVAVDIIKSKPSLWNSSAKLNVNEKAKTVSASESVC